MAGIDASTRLVTLLGYPLGHSLSPLIHNTAFQEQDVNMVYLCLAVPPTDVETAVNGLFAARIVGSNVTIPHKQTLYELVDERSERAQAVGAVNTVVCRYDEQGMKLGLFGDNTDVYGFLEPLKPFEAGLRDESFVVLGSGGAARAVVYALLTELRPTRLVIAARSPAKAEGLARDLAAYDTRNALSIVSLSEAGAAIRSSRLIVNTTPLGMHPYEGISPWNEISDFAPNHIVYDLIYNPEETRLLSDARSRGAVVIGGLDMLIYQAAASYVQWTGKEMPVAIVRKALKAHL